jgi:dUTPase
MTKPQTMLEKARYDAQELHKKISANMAKAEHATWADVKAVQADINALGIKMKTLAADQADDVKTGIKAAIVKLEAAGKLVEDKAVAAKDGVKHANAAMLDSAHKAAQSLSAGVAAARTKLAHAIEPKEVIA